MGDEEMPAVEMSMWEEVWKKKKRYSVGRAGRAGVFEHFQQLSCGGVGRRGEGSSSQLGRLEMR
jgi:hypothetical protein